MPVAEDPYLVRADALHLGQLRIAPGAALVLAEPEEGMVAGTALRPVPVVGLVGKHERVEVGHHPAVGQQADAGSVPHRTVLGEGARPVEGTEVGPGVAAVIAFGQDDPRGAGDVDVRFPVQAQQLAVRQQAEVGERLVETVVASDRDVIHGCQPSALMRWSLNEMVCASA